MYALALVVFLILFNKKKKALVGFFKSELFSFLYKKKKTCNFGIIREEIFQISNFSWKMTIF